jgi:hypothetical protein
LSGNIGDLLEWDGGKAGGDGLAMALLLLARDLEADAFGKILKLGCSGGVRKVRWAARSRGKRGGFRVVYYFHSEAFPVFLLIVYSKSQKANLTKAERNELKTLVPLLVKNYSKGRKKRKTGLQQRGQPTSAAWVRRS